MSEVISPWMTAMVWVTVAAGMTCSVWVMLVHLVFERWSAPVGVLGGRAGGVAGSTPLSRRAGGEFRRERQRAGLGEIRRSRTGAAQVSVSEPQRGVTPTGPRRPH